jgi:2-amino-4-hydroxy-6-hydroxymethyldihydropteridine diphosphokinase
LTTFQAVVGLGANLGDRLGSLRAATRALGDVAAVKRASRVYETAPVGPAQPEFLNAAVLCAYEGTPEALLDELLAIEVRLGRVRGERWGPRTIDLDILWIDGLVYASDRLVVPHPHLHERAFAMVPLLEVAPWALDPRTGQPLIVPPGDVRPTSEAL